MLWVYNVKSITRYIMVGDYRQLGVESAAQYIIFEDSRQLGVTVKVANVKQGKSGWLCRRIRL